MPQELKKYTYLLLNKNNKKVDIYAFSISDANDCIIGLFPNTDPMLKCCNNKIIEWDRRKTLYR